MHLSEMDATKRWVRSHAPTPFRSQYYTQSKERTGIFRDLCSWGSHPSVTPNFMPSLFILLQHNVDELPSVLLHPIALCLMKGFKQALSFFFDIAIEKSLF